MGAILLAIALALLWHSYQLYKQEKANKELNELYMKRFGEQKRVEKLIMEKPENIMLVSDIWSSRMALRYIGRHDNLDKLQAKNGDYAIMDGRDFIYKDGKWYEIVNDMPPRIDYCYRLRY